MRCLRGAEEPSTLVHESTWQEAKCRAQDRRREMLLQSLRQLLDFAVEIAHTFDALRRRRFTVDMTHLTEGPSRRR